LEILVRRRAERLDLKKLREGQREACEALVCQHYKSIYRFMVYLTGDTILAEELTQETFTSAWANIDSYKRLASLGTWLHQIAYHKFVDSRRGVQHDAVLMDKIKQEKSEISETSNPLYQLTANEHTRMLYKAMHRLESPEYVAIVLHYIQDLSFREMARVLEQPVGTVKWRTSVALRRLKELLIGRL
jgi:RNA polymerase sigma-70 factor (ECF subfamily)